MTDLDRAVELQQAREPDVRATLRRLLAPTGDERAVDVGTGTGALAFALAPLVAEVVGVDVSGERLAAARRLGESAGNVSFVDGDATKLPFPSGSFDLAVSARALHHVRRPELAMAELTRVTRRGGRILVVDQLAPIDPLVAFDVDRFERARDPTHARLLPDGDLRAMFEMNGLVLLHDERVAETRRLDDYLDLAGCGGDDRARAESLAPRDPYPVELGWYVLRR